MVTRTLDPHEWPLVDGTELGDVLPLLRPCADDVRVVACFDDAGELVGCWAALRMVHVEGVWVADGHRTRAAVARALMTEMARAASEWGVTSAITGATNAAVEALILRHGGAKLPASYVFPLGMN